MQIQENIPLAPLTTFRAGGPARFFVRARAQDDVREAARFARGRGLPLFALGGGSNLLVRDGGFDGVVVKIETAGVQLERDEGKALLVAAAGEPWDGLVARAVEENLWGLENLSGIPGTVGGAVVQNIGAYGQALSQALLWAETLDCESGEVRRFSNEECAFDYRDSTFKHDGGRHIVLRAAFALSSEPKPDVSYKDLAQAFAGKSPTLAEIRAAVLAVRAGKFPDLSVEGTAGSFFKNPVLAESEALALQATHPDMPLFPLPEAAGRKVPLAYLFDRGLALKGYARGRARLFEKQPLVIAAQFGAGAEEIEALAEEVRKKIFEKYAIVIEPEVRIIGARA